MLLLFGMNCMVFLPNSSKGIPLQLIICCAIWPLECNILFLFVNYFKIGRFQNRATDDLLVGSKIVARVLILWPRAKHPSKQVEVKWKFNLPLYAWNDNPVNSGSLRYGLVSSVLIS